MSKNKFVDTLPTHKQWQWDWSKGRGGIIMPQYKTVKSYIYWDIEERVDLASDRAKVSTLSKHLVSGQNIIGNINGDDFADVSEIAKIIKISEKKTKEFLNRMQKARVISKSTSETNEKTVWYAINPVFYNVCKYVPLPIYRLFKADIDTVIPEWMKQQYKNEMVKRGGWCGIENISSKLKNKKI